jgi:hypothetical protein
MRFGHDSLLSLLQDGDEGQQESPVNAAREHGRRFSREDGLHYPNIGAAWPVPGRTVGVC